MGGAWERLVKSIKTAFKATLTDRYPTDEVLLTLIIAAEHAVNSHPLTHVSHDPDDPEALTPNHFLLGRSSNVQTIGVFNDKDMCLRKEWRRAERLGDHFWKRWTEEYLPTLVKRDKWHHQREPVKVGDIVVLVGSDLPRNRWPKGRVVAVYPGKDGQVRVVDVKTTEGTYRRPVAKLCVLDVRREDDPNILKEQKPRGEKGRPGSNGNGESLTESLPEGSMSPRPLQNT